MRVAAPDGTALDVGVHGTGAGAVVLVHGVAGDRRATWRELVPALSRPAWALDRRGRGDSGDAADHSLAREVADVAAVARAAPDPTVLCGHSFGAWLALLAAREAAVAGLVCYEGRPVSGPKGFDAADADRVAAALADEGRDAALGTFLRDVAGVDPDTVAALRASADWDRRVACADTVPRELRALAADDRDPVAVAPPVPTLLVVGSAPAPATARRYADAVDAARVETLPGAGNAAMHERPAALAALVAEVG